MVLQCLPGTLPEFHDPANKDGHGDQGDPKYEVFNVVNGCRDFFAHQVSQWYQRPGPQYCSCDIVEVEPPEVYPDGTCENGYECTDDRQKATGNQGNTSVFLIIIAGFIKVSLLKEKGIFFEQQPLAKNLPGKIAGDIAGNGCSGCGE